MRINISIFKTLCSLFFIGVESKLNYWESDSVKYGPASNRRNVQIHSRHGHYLSINNKGEVNAVWNPKSPDGKFIITAPVSGAVKSTRRLHDEKTQPPHNDRVTRWCENDPPHYTMVPTMVTDFFRDF